MHVPTAVGDGRPRTAAQDDLRPRTAEIASFRGLPRLERSDRVLPGVSAVSSKKHVGHIYLPEGSTPAPPSVSVPRGRVPRFLVDVDGRPPSPPQVLSVDAGCPPLPRCAGPGARRGRPRAVLAKDCPWEGRGNHGAVLEFITFIFGLRVQVQILLNCVGASHDSRHCSMRVEASVEGGYFLNQVDVHEDPTAEKGGGVRTGISLPRPHRVLRFTEVESGRFARSRTVG